MHFYYCGGNRSFAGVGGSEHTHCGSGRECNGRSVMVAVMVRKTEYSFSVEVHNHHRRVEATTDTRVFVLGVTQSLKLAVSLKDDVTCWKFNLQQSLKTADNSRHRHMIL